MDATNIKSTLQVSNKAQCFVCERVKTTYKCSGCLKDFCHTHLQNHRQTHRGQYNEIKNDCDRFLQSFVESDSIHSNKNSLLEEIHRWEKKSIDQIKQIADECRQQLISYTNFYYSRIENQLRNLIDELKRIEEENEWNDMELDRCKNKLEQITEVLAQSPEISIQEDFTAFVKKISVVAPTELIDSLNNMKWNPNGITVAGRNNYGNKTNHLYCPQGIYVDDELLYIADWGNDRIVRWKCYDNDGHKIAGEKVKGYAINRLEWPTAVIVHKPSQSLIISDQGNRRVIQKSLLNDQDSIVIIKNIKCRGLAIDKNGYLYVSDCERNEVQQFTIGTTKKTIVAGGHGQGEGLNQLNFPTYIFVDDNESIYISDCNNHRVMKWLKGAKEGIIVAGGNGEGNNLRQLFHPQDRESSALSNVLRRNVFGPNLWCQFSPLYVVTCIKVSKFL